MLTRLVYFDEIEGNSGKTNREKQRLSVSVSEVIRFLNRDQTGAPIQLVSGCDLRSSEMLRSLSWHLVADVSGQSIGPIFKGQVFKTELTGCTATAVTTNLRCVTP